MKHLGLDNEGAFIGVELPILDNEREADEKIITVQKHMEGLKEHGVAFNGVFHCNFINEDDEKDTQVLKMFFIPKDDEEKEYLINKLSQVLLELKGVETIKRNN